MHTQQGYLALLTEKSAKFSDVAAAFLRSEIFSVRTIDARDDHENVHCCPAAMGARAIIDGRQYLCPNLQAPASRSSVRSAA
jgi:hypothetical protein